MLMGAATVVQVLQDLFYVLLHVLCYLRSLLYRCFSTGETVSGQRQHTVQRPSEGNLGDDGRVPQ